MADEGQPATLIVVDADAQAHTWLTGACANAFTVREATSAAQALAWAATPVTVVIALGRTNDLDPARFIASVAEARRHRRPAVFFALASGDAPEASAVEGSELPEVLYELRPGLGERWTRSLLERSITARPETPRHDLDVDELDDALRGCREPAELEDRVAARLHALLAADRVRVLFFDHKRGVLWSSSGDDDLEVPARAGLLGYVVRTCTEVVVDRARSDPRYRAAIDDPDGDGTERLLAHPILSLDGAVHGVAVAVRRGHRASFSALDVGRMRRTCSIAVPHLDRLARESQATGDSELVTGLSAGVFRPEAIEAFVRRGERGKVIRVYAGWVRVAYWSISVATLGAVLFASVARIHQHAEGPAEVHVARACRVHLAQRARIEDVAVSAGQRVAAGQRLLRATPVPGADPPPALVPHPGPGTVAIGLAIADDGAVAAPCDGTVTAVHARTGGDDAIAGGLLELECRDEVAAVTATIPRQQLPRLARGQRIIFALTGYPDVALVGELATIAAAGGDVQVTTLLPSAQFHSEHELLRLHDDMRGTARIELASQTLVEALLLGKR